ncbi:unnamed protein product, partial [Prorocentrum cordatum]
MGDKTRARTYTVSGSCGDWTCDDLLQRAKGWCDCGAYIGTKPLGPWAACAGSVAAARAAGRQMGLHCCKRCVLRWRCAAPSLAADNFVRLKEARTQAGQRWQALQAKLSKVLALEMHLEEVLAERELAADTYAYAKAELQKISTMYLAEAVGSEEAEDETGAAKFLGLEIPDDLLEELAEEGNGTLADAAKRRAEADRICNQLYTQVESKAEQLKRVVDQARARA